MLNDKKKQNDKNNYCSIIRSGDTKHYKGNYNQYQILLRIVYLEKLKQNMNDVLYQFLRVIT